MFLEESWSYIECIRKPNLRGAICRILFQVIDFCRVFFQFVHWTPFRNLLLSTSLLSSWMTMSRQFLPLVFDHYCFSFVSNPHLRVWVYPMISLKIRLTLALLLVSLTFHFFPVFNVGFSDFMASSFESSCIIWRLIFPDLNSSTIDLSGNFNFACLQYKGTSDKPGGKPNHFQVYLFILASIHSTVLVAILYMSSSHNNIRINICCWHHTLNFPCRGQWSILWRPF